MRQTISLSGIWRYQPDIYAEGERFGYTAADTDVRYWREARVPGRLDNVITGMEAYEGAAWFRRTFSVSDDWRGRRIALRFEGVNYTAAVYLNGQLLGRHDDGFLPFEFRVDPWLKFTGDNCLVVRADNTRRPGDVPGLERGWRPFGGILREVLLHSTPLLHIVQAQVIKAGDDGALAVQVRIANEGVQSARMCCRLALFDPAGNICITLDSPVPAVAAGQSTVCDLAGAIPSPRLWHPDAPNLYTARVTLMADGQSLDQCRTRLGFRAITTSGSALLLNGQPIHLLGFNRHEDSPHTDMCHDLATVRADLLDMKRLGANFVRLCHYPHHPGELDLCDELGLVVMAEIPLYFWHGLQTGQEAFDSQMAAARRQLTAMIDRDRNHPAIAFWSVSNESDEERPEVAGGNAELVMLCRGLDGTRLSTHVSNRWAQFPHFEADDIACVNDYPTTWGSHSRHPAGAAASWREKLAKLHALYPDKPILISEFGHPALDGLFGNTLGEDAQARALEAQFAAFTAPYICGATIWCYAHHPWPEANYINYMTTSPFGIVNRQRRQLAAWPVVQRMFHQHQGKPLPTVVPWPTGKDVPVRMIRPHLHDIPQIALAPGFAIRSMHRDEAALWTDVQRDAEPILTITDQLFWQEFGSDAAAVQWRCFLIFNPAGLAVGTISAWYSRDYLGQDYGRIHWVAVRPSARGRGLARAGMTHAMNALAQWHERAWLQTSSTRLTAIRIYLEFGFVPQPATPQEQSAWRNIAGQLDHPALAALRG